MYVRTIPERRAHAAPTGEWNERDENAAGTDERSERQKNNERIWMGGHGVRLGIVRACDEQRENLGRKSD